MIIEDLGYNSSLENHRKRHHLDSFGVGPVMSEHKARYIFKTAKNKFDVELISNLRFAAESRSDFPAVFKINAI
jgi:ribosome biogenesis GTPase